ncbi:hypothetical protein Ferp_0558 [Ferroglobus placidus DSM 10642]|uniref:Uncharacterized protein n=1 Tax=Ferroglobus placidus (strain DSM 10642 / AEDII12DO) TaxID=589924 RepID=D3S398_FERPA|nr:hypothetical protein [Ferroglobus placidus]ADC64731.1 hypothetical protein Ferp_0558 [Ferroglobus placidus DSM 10642]
MRDELDELVHQAFREACSGEGCSIEKGDGRFVVRHDTDVLSVRWPEIEILNTGLKTMRVLVKALHLLQIRCEGTLNFLLKLYDRAVMQCLPVVEGAVIDLEKRRAEVSGGKQPGQTELVDMLNRLNDFFLNAAAKYGQITANTLYSCILDTHLLTDPEDLSSPISFPGFRDLESIMAAATAVAGKRLWFVKFQNSILAKVLAKSLPLHPLSESAMCLLITPDGVSRLDVAKTPHYAAANLVGVLWDVARNERRVKYSWRNEKSAKLLKEFIERARTVEVAGRDQIIGRFVESLPEKARKSLLTLI